MYTSSKQSFHKIRLIRFVFSKFVHISILPWRFLSAYRRQTDYIERFTSSVFKGFRGFRLQKNFWFSQPLLGHSSISHHVANASVFTSSFARYTPPPLHPSYPRVFLRLDSQTARPRLVENISYRYRKSGETVSLSSNLVASFHHSSRGPALISICYVFYYDFSSRAWPQYPAHDILSPRLTSQPLKNTTLF